MGATLAEQQRFFNAVFRQDTDGTCLLQRAAPLTGKLGEPKQVPETVRRGIAGSGSRGAESLNGLRKECRMDGRSGLAVRSVQSMKIIFVLTLLALVACAAEVDSPKPIGHVVDGVYFQKNMFQTTIVELKDGKCRFWFSSDMKIGGEMTQYPLTGAYVINGGEISFISTNSYRRWKNNISKTVTNADGTLTFVVGGTPPDDSPKSETQVWPLLKTNRWTVMNYKGQTTLWRPDGLTHWKQTGQASSYAVMFPTQKRPEEIWSGN